MDIGNPSYSKPTFKDLVQPKSGATPMPWAYIIERAENIPQLDLNDPVISGIHDAYAERGVICRFNGLWSKMANLYKWIHSSWIDECEISLCTKGFFTILFNHKEDCKCIFELGPWIWGRVGLFITPWL